MGQLLAILDAGAQYSKVIDRRIRELSVESVILPLNTPVAKLKPYRALIISGGPQSVYGQAAPKFDPKLFSLNKPILGICYGMQLMNFCLGGGVEKKATREDGQFKVKLETASPLFSGLKKQEPVLLTHGDSVDKTAPGFKITALSNNLIAGIENPKKHYYGVQFHPEVDLTPSGSRIFQNFLFKIAKFEGNYTLDDREAKAIAYIREKAADKPVLVLVSGGVDSAASAILLTKALGKEKVFALHIDPGFMRLKESAQVAKALTRLGLNLTVVRAAKTFLNARTKINGQWSLSLDQTINPEEKRIIVGDTYIHVLEKALKHMKLPKDIFLAQGSLRPDLIESASTTVSGVADHIKTHHNDAPLVRKLREQGRVIEPLAEYHKDEVRLLARSLGLPEEIVWRQPFPGPGLSIRILCAQKPYMDPDFQETNDKLSQFGKGRYRITLLPIRSVGVQGDGRTYKYMAAISGQPHWPELFALAKEIPKTIHNINRVVYVFGKEIRGPIMDVTRTRVNTRSLSQLRQADAIVNELLIKHKLTKVLSQVPVILFPIGFGKKGARSIGIRTLITKDFMTGLAAQPGKDMPSEVLKTMVSRILKEVPGIARVAYDLTGKPPATTEWE